MSLVEHATLSRRHGRVPPFTCRLVGAACGFLAQLEPSRQLERPAFRLRENDSMAIDSAGEMTSRGHNLSDTPLTHLEHDAFQTESDLDLEFEAAHDPTIDEQLDEWPVCGLNRVIREAQEERLIRRAL